VVRVRIGSEERTLTWDEWEQQVRSGRIPARSEVQIEAITGDGWVQAGDLEMYTSLREGSVRAFEGSGAIPIATALLVGINIRIWWSQLWLPPARDTLLGQCLAGHASVLEGGEGWRMLATGFCHTDLMHIGANLLWMVFAGWGVERALGWANLVTLFVSSVVVGSLLSILFAPETSALGASGGVFGLVAAVIVLGFARPDVLPEDRRGVYGFAMFPYLLIMFLGGLTDDSIANWAHFGGMITGGLLATVLDPVGLQRRRGWNARWQGLVASLMVLMILVPAVAGPRIQLLVDERDARAAFSKVKPTTPDTAYHALRYRVPAGWRPAVNSAGDPAFRSPVRGTTRSWAVMERTERQPLDPAALLDRWRERLERGHPEVQWTDAVPESLGTFAGLGATAHLSSEQGDKTLHWWGTSRGLYSLQVVSEVDDAHAGRVQPLLRRLREQITWDDPESLRDAIWEHERRPSRSSRAELARVLGEVGERDQSVEIWLGLIAEDPGKRAHWDGLLETLEWYPDYPDAAALWERALVEQPSAHTVDRIARGLDASGASQTADGLVDLAWATDPGNRSLKRLRRGRGQSTALDPETLMPWERAIDPADGTPRATIAIPEAELTLVRAEANGRAQAAEHARIEAAAAAWIADSERRDLPAALLYLRFGWIPDELPEALDRLADDFDRVPQSPPPWLSERLRAAVEAEPSAAERLRSLAASP